MANILEQNNFIVGLRLKSNQPLNGNQNPR